LTDSQIVERIRLMLDTGESVAQQHEIEALRAAQARMDEALLVMEQRAVKAESTLNALAELAGDAVREAS
jgi:NACalpha-BTF3-like transcription factor